MRSVCKELAFHSQCVQGACVSRAEAMWPRPTPTKAAQTHADAYHAHAWAMATVDLPQPRELRQVERVSSTATAGHGALRSQGFSKFPEMYGTALQS
jgi:hypothetical protein